MSTKKDRKKYAVGIVVHNRLDFTCKTLMSLVYSTQSKSSYDVFIINNGSDDQTTRLLNEFITNKLLPVVNLINCPEMSVPKAWNLFMLLAKDYDYRIKLDNDMVMQNTILAKPTGPGSWYKVKSDADKKIELLPSQMIIGNSTARKNKKTEVIQHSNFLDMMSDLSQKDKIDLVALVPISPGQPFSVMYHEVARCTWNGRSYLFGACMMISKKCFDTLGYFDERLPRRIDIEYSQRALRNGFNLGYVENYGAIHLGALGSTEPRHIADKKLSDAIALEREFVHERFVPSIWESRPDRFLQFSHKNQVLNIIQ